MFIKAIELVGETLKEMGQDANIREAVDKFKGIYHSA
jgi:hypothetical protein